MNVKGITMGIVAVIVSLLIVVTCAIPIISDSVATEDTFTNTGYRMSPVGDGVLVIDYADDVVKINDTEYNYSARPITQGTIMFYETAHSQRVGYLYVNVEGDYSRANVNRTDTMTMTYDGETKTCHIDTVHNGTSYSSDYTYTEEIYYLDPNGNYVWSGELSSPAYIPDDWSRFNTWSDGADYFYAVIQDDIQINYSSPPEGTTTTLVTSDVEGHTGIKTIDSYTLNIPEQDPINCRGYILPYKITAERTEHVDGNVATILTVIPVMMVLAILIGAVTMFIKTRRD